MENSVKALYIAAGMLLGVMILSVWVYIFSQGASLGRNYEADRKTEQIQAFNSQFDKYTGVLSPENWPFESKSNTPSDVISCASLAYNINQKNEFDEKNCVEVVVKNLPSGKTYYIHSSDTQPKNAFEDASKNTIEFNQFLSDFNKVKILYSSNSEVVYNYYFNVEADGLSYSEETGKINKIVFTCKKVKNFSELAE